MPLLLLCACLTLAQVLTLQADSSCIAGEGNRISRMNSKTLKRGVAVTSCQSPRGAAPEQARSVVERQVLVQGGFPEAGKRQGPERPARSWQLLWEMLTRPGPWQRNHDHLHAYRKQPWEHERPEHGVAVCKGGHLFDRAAFHCLSGALEVRTAQQLSAVLWPPAQVKGTHPTWPSRQNGGTGLRAKAAALAGGSAPSTPGVADALHPDGAAEGRGRSADLGLQKLPRPFFWGRDRQQTCLQKVCPGGGPPAAGDWAGGSSEKAVKHQGGWEGDKELVPSAVCSSPAAHSQTAKNSPTGTHWREGGQ